MTAAEAGFLRAIEAAPDDDTARLAYADWLDDNDRPDDAFYARARVAVKPVLADPDDDAARFAFADWADLQGRRDRAALIRKQLELERKPDCPDWCDHDPAKCAVTRLEREIDALLKTAARDVWGGDPQFELTANPYVVAGGSWGDWWRTFVRGGFIERVYATGPAWAANADRLTALNSVRHVFAEGFPAIAFAPGTIGPDEYRTCWIVRPDGSKMPPHPIAFARFPDVARGRIAARLCESYWPGVAFRFRA